MRASHSRSGWIPGPSPPSQPLGSESYVERGAAVRRHEPHIGAGYISTVAGHVEGLRRARNWTAGMTLVPGGPDPKRTEGNCLILRRRPDLSGTASLRQQW